MKVIPKLQSGGFMSLFTSYNPILTPTLLTPSQKLTRSSSSNEDKGKLTEKDLFELVSKVDGLPNDTKAIVSNLLNIFLIQLITGESDVTNLANTYLSSLFLIKLAAHNKKEYDDAKTQVTKNGGLNEYAITDSGNVIVMNEEGDISQVGVSELLKNSDKYKPLTNSNLLWLRAYQPEYSNLNQLLNTVTNGIGMELVDRMIRSKLTSLGTTEQIRSGYSIKSEGHIIQGLKVLSDAESAAIAGLTGMTLDGMYKNKLITKDLKQQAEAALQYIYNTLPKNAQTLLSIRAGNASNPTEGAMKLIFQLITSRMSYTNSSETEWEGTLSQVAKSGSGSDSSDDEGIKTNPYYHMARSIGGENSSITINKGTNYELSVNGTLYSSLPGLDGKPIGKTSLQTALLSGLQGVITDPKAITFGNVALSSADFENVMFDGTSGGTLAILPAKTSANGTKMVDLEVLDRWEAANKLLKLMGINSIFDEDHQQEIAQVLYNNDLEKFINVSTGTVDYSEFGQFLIVDGYVVDKNGTFENSSFVTKVDNDDEIAMIEKALSTNDKLNNYHIDVNDFFDWNGHDDVYKGSIYIPITNNQLKAVTAGGENIKEGVAVKKETEWLMFLRMQSAKKPDLGMI